MAHLLAVWLVVCLGAAPSWCATIVDPVLRFRQIRTDHFVIYFHQGETELAQRLAGIAEEVWADASQHLDLPPPSRTYVVLSDHTDSPNGWATPLPYDLILITASAPSGAEFIGNTGDWLRTVFTHEFVHILHLDQSAGWARGLRRVFGRLPLAMPNLFLPTWHIEGLATFSEGLGRADGRLHAPDFREVMRAQASTGRAFPLDRANGGLTAWPGGTAPYAHGMSFHEYLAVRHGARSFGELAKRTSGRVPFTASRSFRSVYGSSLGALWTDYQRERVAAAAPRGDDDRATVRVTRSGFVAAGVRFWRTCERCPPDLVYALRTPHVFPSLMRVPLSGGPPQTLTRRFLGATAAPTARSVVFDQQELRRNAGLYSDLYAFDRESGEVRALTREARLNDPDISTDERRLVAVKQARGRRDLVVADLDDRLRPGALTLVAGDPETQYSTPRWSPDGRLIAAERRQLGRHPEIVIVDPATGSVRVIGTGATRAVTPAWHPNGRSVVAALDTAEGPFALFELDAAGAESRRRLTNRLALWPDVSPDGQTLAFVGITEAGFDVFTTPYRPLSAAAADREGAAPAVAVTPPLSSRPFVDAPYRPWRTLRPTSWTPLLTADRDFTKVGVLTSGVDALGYHSYVASAAWLVDSPAEADRFPRAQPDWEVSYLYDRFRPQLFARHAQTMTFAPRSSGGEGLAALRERRDELGVVVPIRRARWTQRALVSGRRETGDFATQSAQDFSRTALRAGWALSTAQVYGYSISPEHGVSLGVAAEAAGARASDIGEAVTYKGDVRAFAPGLARHHVLAVRLAAARSRGPRGVRRVFGLGGAGSAPDVLDLGVDAVGLLRGFPTHGFAGPNAALLNIDYRWPLARLERGAGTWPAFVHTVHASLFADAGHAWTSGLRATDIKAAAGVELSVNIVAGYALPITASVGAAWRRDPTGRVGDGPATYVRIGRAF